MPLEVIYVVRHGYRMNWSVNPATGEYRTTMPTPTGIPSDPQLASYGTEQAEELGEKIVTLDPPVDVVYSSPFYRCLQTIRPAVERLVANGRTDGKVRVENGIGEFFGLARFEHPSPAPVSVLQKHFAFLSDTHAPAIIPSTTGESLEGIHNRHAYALHRIIQDLDADPAGPRAALFCTHAASMICMGRVLTGKMPANIEEEDFRCGTCALSTFVRRSVPDAKTLGDEVAMWDSKNPEHIPMFEWDNGKGVAGGWDCKVNGDCSFLSGGEERTWNFAMERAQAQSVAASDGDEPMSTEDAASALVAMAEQHGDAEKPLLRQAPAA